jgi:hypothetical protein
VPDIVDAINLKGAKYFTECGFLGYAEEMLGRLSAEASASSVAAALQQRIRDTQITFWKTRYTLALAMSWRFPAYLPGRLYLDFCSQFVKHDQ